MDTARTSKPMSQVLADLVRLAKELEEFFAPAEFSCTYSRGRGSCFAMRHGYGRTLVVMVSEDEVSSASITGIWHSSTFSIPGRHRLWKEALAQWEKIQSSP